MILTGSRKFPYGILNRLTALGLSDGTNAWTSDDHTCYTTETVGDQGFFQILPIFVDHIMFPSLTNSAFVTEVCSNIKLYPFLIVL